MMGGVLLWAALAAAPAAEPAAGDGFALPSGAVRRFGSRQLRHPDKIDALAVSPDGKLLATASYENVIVWDLKTLTPRQTFAKLPARVNTSPTRGGAIAFLPDSASLLVTVRSPIEAILGSTVDLAQVWDVTTGKKTLSLTGKHTYSHVCWPTAGGKEFVALYPEDYWTVAKSYDARDGKLLRTVRVQIGDKPPYIGPSGNLVVSFGLGRLSGGAVNVRTGNLVAESLMAQVAEAALSRDDKLLAWVDSKGTVHVDDLEANKEKFSFPHPVKERPGPMAISADNKTLYLTADYGRLFRWDLVENRKGPDFVQTPNYWNVTAIALSPDESTLFVAADDHLVRRWDTKSGKELPVPDGYARQASVAVLADGKHVAVGDFEGRLDLWELATGKRDGRLDTRYEGVRSLAASADGKWLAVGRRTQDVRVIDLATGKTVRDIPLGDNSDAKWQDPVTWVGFNAAGTVLYATSPRTDLTAWDVAAGKNLWTAKKVGWPVAVDPMGRWLVAGGRTGIPETWRIADAKSGTTTEVELPKGRAGYSISPEDVTWLPDGSRFVSSHWDGTIRLWDPDTRKEAGRFVGRPGTHSCLGVSADGRWLAIGWSDRTVSVWELATRDKVLDLAGHDSKVTQVAFTKDGRGLVSNADLSPILWDLCPKDLPNDGLWEGLGSEDGAKAYRAQWALIKDPSAAVKLLDAQLKPAELRDLRGQFEKWVAGLDSPQFRVREASEKALVAGASKVPVRWLRQALADAKADESRTRLARVLGQWEREPDTTAWRLSRAVQVLELLATPEARALLKSWAASGSPLADEAAGALRRLGPE